VFWVPRKSATRGDIDRALRHAYPTMVLDELDVAVLDRDPTEERLTKMLSSIASTPHLTAVLEAEIGRAHVLHVNCANAPDWQQLNREFSGPERERAVVTSGGRIVYWNILLSRIAPFWTGHWSMFQVEHGTVFPRVVPEEAGKMWTQVTSAVRSILASYGFREVSQELLDSPVKSLRLSRIEEGSADDLLTVYDAIFSEI
jgi:hypothetical protein